MKRTACFIAALALLFLWRRRNTPPPLSLKNAVIILTGASDGIGRAAAHSLAAHGAHLVLVARRAALLEEVQNELAVYGVQTLIVPADITCDEDVENIVNTAMATFGRIDVLINNAGITLPGNFLSHTPVQVRQVINTNLYGSMRMTQAVLPVMLCQHSGIIMQVGSVSAAIAAPGYVAYGATKSALTAMNESLRYEYSGRGVHFGVFLPSWTRTDMITGVTHAEMQAAGLASPLLPVEDAPVVARALVNAIIHRRRWTIRGSGFWLVSMGQMLLPDFVEALFRRFYDRERMMAVMRRFGTG